MANFFQTCLKGFKLNKMIVEPKIAWPVNESAQLVELAKESIDLFAQLVEGCKKKILSSRMFVRPVEVKPHMIEYQSRGDQGLTITYYALNANG